MLKNAQCRFLDKLIYFIRRQKLVFKLVLTKRIQTFAYAYRVDQKFLPTYFSFLIKYQNIERKTNFINCKLNFSSNVIFSFQRFKNVFNLSI